ncbi:MAG: hypothetical protein Q8P22_12335 [Chloroflexota bacterium]|nr:hypothetical protein [Chloroflexota bacterium]
MPSPFVHLFAPLRIGSITVPNRILQTSHAKVYEDYFPGGLVLEESVGIARLLAPSGRLDWINVSAGAYWSFAPIIVAPMAFPPGFLLHLAAGIKEVIEKVLYKNAQKILGLPAGRQV